MESRVFRSMRRHCGLEKTQKRARATAVPTAFSWEQPIEELFWPVMYLDHPKNHHGDHEQNCLLRMAHLAELRHICGNSRLSSSKGTRGDWHTFPICCGPFRHGLSTVALEPPICLTPSSALS